MAKKPKQAKRPNMRPVEPISRVITPLNIGAVPAEPPQVRANWGANERPRACVNCGCTATNTVGGMTRILDGGAIARQRKCLSCGRLFMTIERPAG